MDAHLFRRELLTSAWTMQRTLHKTMAPICQRHGLTMQQLHVLMELSRMPGAAAGELSDHAGILRTNFASVCRRLEERGLVERRRNPNDRRALALHVTEAGRALLREVDADVCAQCGAAFESEPQDTFDTILAGLSELNRFAGKLGR